MLEISIMTSAHHRPALGKEEGRLCKERVGKATRAACVLLREKLTSLEAPSSAVDLVKIMKFLCITYDNFQK